MDKNWRDKNGIVHKGHCHDSKGEYDVIECSLCGFKHVIPVPTEAFLSEYYKNDFVKNRPKGFYKKLEEDLSWVEIFYNEKFELLEKYTVVKNPSILDIGSGLGFFLNVGKKRGWRPTGVEPSVESADYSRNLGLEIENIYLDTSNFKQLGKFNVVHMHEVLEHLPNPIDMIQLVKKLLKPRGLICIVSPNDYNPLQEAVVNSSSLTKWWLSPPEHINYFDFGSARKLLENAGFKIVEQTATFPLELFLLMGDNYIGNDKVGKIIHNKRVNFENNLNDSGFDNIRRNIYSKFSEIGIGREFCIIGQMNI